MTFKSKIYRYQNRLTVIIIVVLLFSGACTARHSLSNIPDVPKENEIVMTEGMKITATNSWGTMTITAGKGLERSYTWEGATRSVIMIPRKERWYGSLGIYSPGADNWKEHNGITRGVLDEGQLHYDSVDRAMKFFKHPFRANVTVYNDNGLVITCSNAINPYGGPTNTLFVEVWQIYINGKKPTRLPGSQNDKIIVSPSN
jgi:hypothetical protein